jgi:hypothetical protein
VIIIDRLLAGGIGFVLGKVAQVVDAERNDEGALRQQLLDANMQLELGEITESEYEGIEASVLEALREIQDRKGGGARGAIGSDDIAGATVEVEAGSEAPQPSRPRRAGRRSARRRGARKP